MSKVISFRLSEDNPREGQALKVLELWLKQGYSIRHTITESLLSLEDPDARAPVPELDDLKAMLKEVTHLLGQRSQSKPIHSSKGDGLPTAHKLNESFIVSVKQAAKPGVKY